MRRPEPPAPSSDAPGAPPPPPQSLNVYKGRQLVLTIDPRPGRLHSTASAPPTGAPDHPFVDARAHDPFSEDELGALLRSSSTFDEFVRALVRAGYAVTTRRGEPPAKLGVAYRVVDAGRVVGALWDAPGPYLELGGGPPQLMLRHATLTMYDGRRGAAVRGRLSADMPFADVLGAIRTLGFAVEPEPEYRV